MPSAARQPPTRTRRCRHWPPPSRSLPARPAAGHRILPSGAFALRPLRLYRPCRGRKGEWASRPSPLLIRLFAPPPAPLTRCVGLPAPGCFVPVLVEFGVLQPLLRVALVRLHQLLHFLHADFILGEYPMEDADQLLQALRLPHLRLQRLLHHRQPLPAAGPRRLPLYVGRHGRSLPPPRRAEGLGGGGGGGRALGHACPSPVGGPPTPAGGSSQSRLQGQTSHRLLLPVRRQSVQRAGAVRADPALTPGTGGQAFGSLISPVEEIRRKVAVAAGQKAPLPAAASTQLSLSLPGLFASASSALLHKVCGLRSVARRCHRYLDHRGTSFQADKLQQRNVEIGFTKMDVEDLFKIWRLHSYSLSVESAVP